jgi:hypothetical protein
MKDILKTQGATRPVVGIKQLIDYYNENYTKKKEYICKDLKPARMLDEDEYYKFLRDTGLMTPLEVRYYPLFKISKIKNNRPRTITYIFKIDNEEYEGIMRRVQENVYSDGDTKISINGDEIFLASNDVFIDTEACSLTLYIDSLELPKLEYPKNKIDMYRAYNFIATVCYSINDENLYGLLDMAISDIPLPNNIDEINLFLEDSRFCDILDIRNNAYFINRNKDNYYTILDAIKKGKSIYMDSKNILPYWTINKEEKSITLQSFRGGINITLFENGLGEPLE